MDILLPECRYAFAWRFPSNLKTGDTEMTAAKKTENVVNLDEVAFELGRAAFFAKAADLGGNVSKAAQSPFELAMSFQAAYRAKFVTASLDDAKLAVQAYRDGRKSEPATYGTLGVDDETKAAKAKASTDTAAKNLLTFLTPCALEWEVSLYKQIDHVIAGYAAKDLGPGSKIHCYEKANRELHNLMIEKGHDMQAMAEIATEDYFAAMLIKKGATKEAEGEAGDGANGKNEKTPKAAIEKLEAALKVLRKLAGEDYAGKDDFVNAVAIIGKFYHAEGAK
jgi:hypothetical protein